jgi:hydroxymethylpyrimidine/phosphomethylpyrimidine kinase
MLASAETIKVVAECLRDFKVETMVVDPVCLAPALVSSTGVDGLF